MTLNKILKNFRLSKTLTQQELAKILGVTANYVYMIESGRTPISAKLLRKYAEHFHVSIMWLLMRLADVKIDEARKKIYCKLGLLR